MTRDQVMDALGGWLTLMQDHPMGDALADLLALAYPDSPPAPLMGWGDPIERLTPIIETILRSWDHVARQNGSVGVQYREAARALRFVREQVS